MGNFFATSKLAPESDCDHEALEKATLTPTPTEIQTPPVPTPTTTPSPNIVDKKVDLEDVDLEEKTPRPSTPHPLSYYNDLNRPISKLGQILKDSLENAESIPFPVNRYPSVVTATTTNYNYLNTTNTNPHLNTISEQPTSTSTTDTAQTPLLYDQN